MRNFSTPIEHLKKIEHLKNTGKNHRLKTLQIHIGQNHGKGRWSLKVCK